MNYLEIIGTAIGVIYLYLEYKASIWLWVAGVLMPAIYLPVYYEAGLYADFGISVYYLLASVYGLGCWLRSRGNNSPSGEETPVPRLRHTPAKLTVPLTAFFALLFMAITYLLTTYTDSTVPIADSFTTALSIVAMWMLAHKYAEQWLVWIAVDITSSVLYFYKDLPFTAVLYAAYAVIAVFGYMRWMKIIRKNNEFNN